MANGTDNGGWFTSVLNVLADAYLAPFVFALIIGIPSALLYCLELWAIITNFKHFNSAFFIIVEVRSISNLVNYVFAYLSHRFGKIGLFLPIYLQLPQFGLKFLYFMLGYAFHVENFLTTALLFNRFTSILLPFKYEKLWRYALVPALAVSFILPLPFIIPEFNLDIYIHVQSDNATFTLDYHPKTNDINACEIAAWSAILFGIICFLLNLATFFAYKFGHQQKVNQQRGMANTEYNAQLERKMTIYTIATFFGQFLMSIFWIIVYITGTELSSQNNSPYYLAQALFGLSADQNQALFLANFNQYPWVNDFGTIVIPAWLLFWASTKMREIICKKFQWMNRRQNDVVIDLTKNKQLVKKTQTSQGHKRDDSKRTAAIV